MDEQQERLVAVLRESGPDGLVLRDVIRQARLSYGEVMGAVNALPTVIGVQELEEWEPTAGHDGEDVINTYFYLHELQRVVPHALPVTDGEVRHCPTCTCGHHPKGTEDWRTTQAVVNARATVLRWLKREGPMTQAELNRRAFNRGTRPYLPTAVKGLAEQGGIELLPGGRWGLRDRGV